MRVRHRRLQAVALITLAALLTTSLCLGPLYQRAMEQALAGSVLANASPEQKALRLTAADLKQLGLIDGVIAEPMGGAHQDQHAAIESLGEAVARELDALAVIPMEELLEQRYQKFRRIGEFAVEE